MEKTKMFFEKVTFFYRSELHRHVRERKLSEAEKDAETRLQDPGGIWPQGVAHKCGRSGGGCRHIGLYTPPLSQSSRLQFRPFFAHANQVHIVISNF